MPAGAHCGDGCDDCNDSAVVHVVDIRAGADIDCMEDVVRGACSRSTAGRCGVLETAAYLQTRMTLLRWLSAWNGMRSTSARVHEVGMPLDDEGHAYFSCYVTDYLLIRASYGSAAAPPRVWVTVQAGGRCSPPAAAVGAAAARVSGGDSCEDDDAVVVVGVDEVAAAEEAELDARDGRGSGSTTNRKRSTKRQQQQRRPRQRT